VSVQILKTLLDEAKSELSSLVRQTEKESRLPAKTVAAIAYTHRRVAEKIEDALVKVGKPLAWLTPEPGTWRARCGQFELYIYKDAGAYYWQVSSTEGGAGKTLDEAKEIVSRLIGIR